MWKSKSAVTRRNKNKNIYQTRWKHRQCSEYLIFEPQIDFMMIIHKLQDAIQTTYTPAQMSSLKQFYYNRKYNKEPKRTCMGWTVEYLVNSEYVWILKDDFIDDYDCETIDPLIKKNQVWTHALYPMIDTVKMSPDKLTLEDLASELNAKAQNPKLEGLEKMSQDLQNLLKSAKGFNKKNIFGFAKEYHHYLKKVSQLENAKPITQRTLKQVFKKKRSKTKSWTVSNIQN